MVPAIVRSLADRIDTPADVALCLKTIVVVAGTVSFEKVQMPTLEVTWKPMPFSTLRVVGAAFGMRTTVPAPSRISPLSALNTSSVCAAAIVGSVRPAYTKSLATAGAVGCSARQSTPAGLQPRTHVLVSKPVPSALQVDSVEPVHIASPGAQTGLRSGPSPRSPAPPPPVMSPPPLPPAP